MTITEALLRLAGRMDEDSRDLSDAACARLIGYYATQLRFIASALGSWEGPLSGILTKKGENPLDSGPDGE